MGTSRVAALGLIVLLGGVTDFTLTLTSVSPGVAQEQGLTIERGMSFTDIASLLDTRGLIRSARAFSIYAVMNGVAHQLKPGQYAVRPSVSTPTIVRQLVAGPVDISVTIPEGTSLVDVERLLAARGLLGSGDLTLLSPELFVDDFPFLAGAASLEGFLFPDTYRIAPGSSPRAIARTFLHGFREKALPLAVEPGGALDYGLLTTASLLEREVRSATDRRLVAGIIAERLVLGMALQVDATVMYAVCGGSFEACGGLTEDDFAVESEFNTYVFAGLPPSPIANPGVAALEAARTPLESAYLFYLSDPATGTTVFSETFEEHNEHRARYLQR
ncbi:MAG: endolytic transglycosylase MltG [Candidatus Colwellbacteria bacterium]|nr:endolytic transglycosylase MltG [Candidatus Colwellbacteria bacterium]